MKMSARLKTAVVFTVLSAAAVAATASSALAMPAGDVEAAAEGPVLQRVADGHRIYPGSDSAAAQKARDGRNAPNRFCEKQQQYCE